MAYRIEGRDIVIDGWEKGISDDPYTGISDMRATNIISVPGEASVAFATSAISPVRITATFTVTSADAGADTITFTGSTDGFETRMAIVFAGGSLPTGITAGTPYWISYASGNTLQIYSNPGLTSLVNITATGTGTFTFFNLGVPKQQTGSGDNIYWIQDHLGQVWSNAYTTGINNYWIFTGNNGGNGLSDGNGLVYYEASDGTGYIFSFRNSRIDFTPSANASIAWVYGWNPLDASTGNTSNYLNAGGGGNDSHFALVGPGNRVYYCDKQYVGSWFQKDPAVAFVPTTLSTYTFTKQALTTEFIDRTTCLVMLNNYLLVGGSLADIYVWDRFSHDYLYRIRLAESNVWRMETINTTTYIFVGNRGRIYKTNGSQASLYKKVPDHLSNTIEPYFTWGGTASFKNQLYFGISATTNGSTAITTYGGVWAIDTDTDAMRITNQLSYGTYAGRATIIIPRPTSIINASNPAGIGLYIGWNDGTSATTVNGIDTSSSTPYTSYVAYIDTDMIPIAQFLTKKTFENIEFKLTVPLASSEGVKISYRTYITDSFVQVGETTTAGLLSDVYTANFENVQWVQLRIELKSKSSSPTFTRLKEVRLR